MTDAIKFVDRIGSLYASVTDTFTRSVSSSWGSADSGQAWTLGGDGGAASQFSVNGSAGVIAPGAVSAIRQTYITVGQRDMTVACVLSPGAVATGASIQQAVMARRVDADNMYQAVVLFGTAGTAQLQIAKRVAGSSTVLTTASGTIAYDASTDVYCAITVEGASIVARAYDVAAPSTVLATAAVDTAVAAAGGAGCRAFLTTGNTNVAPQLTYDTFAVTSLAGERLDLNDGTVWGVEYTDGFADPPPRKTARAGGLTTHGEHIAAGAYGNRTLRLKLALNGSDLDDVAEQIQALQRELDRPHNWLMWQPEGATAPLWFKTLWSAEQRMRIFPGPGTYREVDVTLAAAPFACGERVTLATQTVTNDLAAASNGCYLDLAAGDVLGDVETPAVLQIAYSGVEDKGPTAVAVRRRGTPASAPFVLQAESMTLGTDTTLPGNDAVMSGSASNYARTSFATTTTMATRLTSAVFPSTPSVDARGTYRVFLRHRRSVAGDTIKVRLGYLMGATTVTNREVTLPAGTTNRRWADLGTVQIPAGADPRYDVAGAELAARGMVFILQAERTSGSGNLDFDALAFLPADDRLALVSWPTSSGPTYAVVDGAGEAVYMLGSDGEVYPVEAPGSDGLFPYLSPGVAQRLYVLLNAVGEAATATDTKTDTVSVTVSYCPAYLHARPAAT